MTPRRRDSRARTLALAAGIGVLAVAAGSLHRRSSPSPDGLAPAMPAAGSVRTPQPGPVPAQTADTPAAAVPDYRGAVRTDTLKIRDVPEPGSAAPSDDVAKPAASLPRRFDAGGFASASPAPAQDGYAGAISTPQRPKAETRQPGAFAGRGHVPTKNSAGAAAVPLSDDPRVAAMAGGLVAQARQLKISPRPADRPLDLSKPADVRKAVLEQFALENRVDSDVRQALGGLAPSAGIEAKRQATAKVLAAKGQPADEVSITNALARGLAPPPGSSGAQPEPSPQAIDGAIDRFAAAYADTGDEPAPERQTGTPPELEIGGAAETAAENDEKPGPNREYRPAERPPRGMAEAYKTYAPAFAAALKNFGVAPADILAIAQQETGFGRNMGRVPLPKGLSKRQADLAAAIKLDAAKRLPAPWQNLRGSETGALGPFQFEPATQLWAGRGDPFDWNNQIAYSVPHLLILNGYKPNDPAAQRRAFGRYYGDGNPNGKYALSVAGHSAAIKQALERQADPETGR